MGGGDEDGEKKVTVCETPVAAVKLIVARALTTMTHCPVLVAFTTPEVVTVQPLAVLFRVSTA